MTQDFPEADINYEPIFVARQPIFDRNQDIWGYELLFRHSGTAQAAQVQDEDTATAKVIADGFSLACSEGQGDKKFLINFPQNLILKGTAYALPKDICVVEILETVQVVPEIIDACKKIKEAGYILALDDFVGQPGFEPLIELADIVKVEVLGASPPKVIKLTQMLKRWKCELLAEKVEDKQMFQLTKSLGYSYFQGYFFSKPEIVPGRKISSGAMAKVRLLQELSKAEFEVKHLAKIITADLSLSYRLLKYLNSAGMAVKHKITSIAQAVAILGDKPIKQWLMVVLLSDMAPTSKAEELSFISVQRGRFLELVARTLAPPPFTGDTMFMLGLFSKLDALLNQPMEEIVGPMPLEQEIKLALFGEQNRAHAWLDLVEAVHLGSWERAGELLEGFGVDTEQASILHARATAWTHSILRGASQKVPTPKDQQAQEKPA